ncbi:MAG: hypothetical protein E7570_03960 [Ruminococcaceae bacterium]|nr:hypothetical protein [Oscillospiraceae bacterium]
MKKSLSIILSLLMVITTISALPASAYEAKYDGEGVPGHMELYYEPANDEDEGCVYIYNGFHDPIEIAENMPAGVAYDYATNVLYLNNYNGEAVGAYLQCDQMLDLTIEVKGSCSVCALELWDTHPTITGTGVLTVNSKKTKETPINEVIASSYEYLDEGETITPFTVDKNVTVKIFRPNSDECFLYDVGVYQDTEEAPYEPEDVIKNSGSDVEPNWTYTREGGEIYYNHDYWGATYGKDYENGFIRMRTTFPATKLMKRTDLPAGEDNVFIESSYMYSKSSNFIAKLLHKDGVWYQTNSGEEKYWRKDSYSETYTQYTNQGQYYRYFEYYTPAELAELPSDLVANSSATANLIFSDGISYLYVKNGEEYVIIEGTGYANWRVDPTSPAVPEEESDSIIKISMGRVCHSEKTYWVEFGEHVVDVNKQELWSSSSQREFLNAAVEPFGYAPKLTENKSSYSHRYSLNNNSITFGNHTHKYTSKVTKAATCAKTGVRTYTCTCGDTYTKAIPATGKHTSDKGTVTKKATYTATGTKTYKCTVCGKTLKTETIPKLEKKTNTIKASGKTATVKYSYLKKKNQTVAQKNAFSVTNAKGNVTYAKDSGNKSITVSSAGKITVKKGLKKGTYKVKVKVKAAGNDTYKSATKIVTVTIKVK